MKKKLKMQSQEKQFLKIPLNLMYDFTGRAKFLIRSLMTRSIHHGSHLLIHIPIQYIYEFTLSIRQYCFKSNAKALFAKKRNAALNVEALLICPACKSLTLSYSKIAVSCQNCGAHYKSHDGILELINQK